MSGIILFEKVDINGISLFSCYLVEKGFWENEV